MTLLSRHLGRDTRLGVLIALMLGLLSAAGLLTAFAALNRNVRTQQQAEQLVRRVIRLEQPRTPREERLEVLRGLRTLTPADARWIIERARCARRC